MLKDKVLLIWDIDSEEIPAYDMLILWQSYKANNNEAQVSIPDLVEHNAAKLKSEYLALVYELGELKVNGKRIIDHLEINSEFSHWWMTLLAEKCNFAKSPQIDNVIKLMALNAWIKNKDYHAVKLVSENNTLAESMDILVTNLGIDFEFKKIKTKKYDSNLARGFYNNLPEVIKATTSLVVYLRERWKLKGVGQEKWKGSSAKTLFVSYLFHFDLHAMRAGRYVSGYWSALPNTLDKNNIQSNWLHLYIKSTSTPTAYSAKKLIDKLNDNYEASQSHVFLD